MRTTLLSTLAVTGLNFAAASSPQHNGVVAHGEHAAAHRAAWDDNGGYPFGIWGLHTPGGQAQAAVSYSNSTFKQLIDHSDPSLGTFDQFYYYDTTNWKGPGSPVILFTPGEVNATRYYSYLTPNRTTGVLAQEIGAAVIVLEHRYWGTSTPFTDLKTENMKYLTLENAIKDMTYFANHADLPFAKNGSNAGLAPWVTMGGSYSGALSAWIASVDPGTLWAYHSSSAPVEAISDYWSYFLPIQQGMPKNCSKDVSLVIDYMDAVFTNGSAQEQHDLKALFQLDSLAHNDDVMAALENGPWLWQGNQFYTNTGFFDWCDYIENVLPATNRTNGTSYPMIPGASGVGLKKALAGYAKWWTDIELPYYCQNLGPDYPEWAGENNTLCFDTYNASSPMFTDTSLSNVIDRQWVWMTCNEPFGYWQTGAPEDRPSLVSRLVDPEYWIRQCGLFFPDGPEGETYGIKEGKTEEEVNDYTGGWDIVNTTRLLYVNGEFDPWREASVSSDIRPGGPLNSTEKVPVYMVPGGIHVSDLVTKNGDVNAGVRAVQDKVVAQLSAWVDEFPKPAYGPNSKKAGQKWRA
jgi:hypothetical protein